MKMVNRANALVFASMAIATRLLFALVIDGFDLMSSGWLAAIAAGILTAPLMIALMRIERLEHGSLSELMSSGFMRLYCAAMWLFLLFDAGTGMVLLARSAGYMSSENMMTSVLVVVCAVVVLLACLTGAQAVAGASSIILRLVGLAFVVILITQLGSLNAYWLTPILGPGPSRIARHVPSLCGMLTGLIPIWMLAKRSASPPRRINMLGVLAITTIVVTVCMLLFAMLLPPMPSGTSARWFQLDRLLSNGRIAQELQVVMVPLWYVLIVHAISYMCIGAIHSLSTALPALKSTWATLLSVACAIAVAFSGIVDRAPLELVNAIRWPVLTLPILIYWPICAIRKRKEART